MISKFMDVVSVVVGLLVAALLLPDLINMNGYILRLNTDPYEAVGVLLLAVVTFVSALVVCVSEYKYPATRAVPTVLFAGSMLCVFAVGSFLFGWYEVTRDPLWTAVSARAVLVLLLFALLLRRMFQVLRLLVMPGPMTLLAP